MTRKRPRRTTAREKAAVADPSATSAGGGEGDPDVPTARGDGEQLDALAGEPELSAEAPLEQEVEAGVRDESEATEAEESAAGEVVDIEDTDSAGAAEAPEAAEADVAVEDPRFLRARELEAAGDLTEAIAVYRELLFDEPRNLKARNNLGVIYDRRGDHLLALEQFEAARDIDAENVDVLLNVAAAQAALRHYDAAEKELRRAHRLDPGRADVHASMGILSFRRGLYAQAELELKRALELDQGHATAYFYRGECLNQLGRVDEALQMLERSVSIHPHNPRAYFTMGILFDRKHLPQQAAAMYRKAREISAA